MEPSIAPAVPPADPALIYCLIGIFLTLTSWPVVLFCLAIYRLIKERIKLGQYIRGETQ